MNVNCWLLVALFVCEFPAFAETFTPVFGSRPRLAISAEEIKARRASPEFEQIKTAAVRRATPHIENPVDIPTKWGNWIFYYANPKTGGGLTAISNEEHKDPKTGEIFTDDKIVDSYRTILHNRVNRIAVDLGWAYLWSGDDKYAQGVRRILVKLADVYHTFPKRADRWGHTGFLAKYGGRRYSQSLSEAVGVIELAKAYDLTRNSPVWSKQDVLHVESDFFRPTADTLLYTTFAHNHQTWLNAGLMCIASALGDSSLMTKVLTMKRGFLYQLEHNIDQDGMWNEGTMAYHNYALQALIASVDAGRRAGIPLHQNGKFRSMIEAPLKYCYPNGQFPAINDSDPSNIRSFQRNFQWAWEVYKDPFFAQALANGDKKRLQQLLGKEATPQPVFSNTSTDLKGIGLLVLRRGEGKEAINVMLDYGAHGAAHGQPDKLNLIVYANGREWLFDPGRLNYRHEEYKTYYTQTSSHNTVVLNGLSQSPDNGTLLFLDSHDAFAAAGGESTGAYPGTVLRRYILLADTMLIDLFEVESEKPASIDWLASASVPTLVPLGKDTKKSSRESSEFPPSAPPLGDNDGYQYFSDIVAPADSPKTWDFVQDANLRLRLWLASTPEATLMTARRLGYQKTQHIPCLIRRVNGRKASFLTVYDLGGAGDHVTAVSSIAGEVSVKTTEGLWRVKFSRAGAKVGIDK